MRNAANVIPSASNRKAPIKPKPSRMTPAMMLARRAIARFPGMLRSGVRVAKAAAASTGLSIASSVTKAYKEKPKLIQQISFRCNSPFHCVRR